MLTGYESILLSTKQADILLCLHKKKLFDVITSTRNYTIYNIICPKVCKNKNDSEDIRIIKNPGNL